MRRRQKGRLLAPTANKTTALARSVVSAFSVPAPSSIFRPSTPFKTSFAAAALGVGLATSQVEAAPETYRVWVAPDAMRVRRDEVLHSGSAGTNNPTWQPGAPARLAAQRDEVVAFQVIVGAVDAPLDGGQVEIAFQNDPDDAEDARLTIERFVEHYVHVQRRSRNEQRPLESLGFSPAARPDDRDELGWVPDALIPVALAPAWAPYPLVAAQSENASLWVDLHVGRRATVGVHSGTIAVNAGPGQTISIPLELTVRAEVLPYRAASILVAYGLRELQGRIGQIAGAEKQLWQLLHAHGIDAFGSIETDDDFARLGLALNGSWFTPEEGYAGPGLGVPPAAIALGLYGSLGEPNETTLATLDRIVPGIPEAVHDVILYAADEECDSPVTSQWLEAVSARPLLRRVKVAHSCARDPRWQNVDLALVPASRFDPQRAEQARFLGRDVWIYNGALPYAGSLHLDAGPLGLCLNGWVAASRPVGRWFYWESTFWNDDNRGGRGPTDPFLNAETFHNADGDSGLLDGLLVYPGTQDKPFADHTLGLVGVVPSIRLKMLRRGVQDAAYVSLATQVNRTAALGIARAIVPRALSEVSAADRSALQANAATIDLARNALARIFGRQAVAAPDVEAQLPRAAKRSRAFRVWFPIGSLAVAAATIGALGWLGARLVRRHRSAGDTAVRPKVAQPRG